MKRLVAPLQGTFYDIGYSEGVAHRLRSVSLSGWIKGRFKLKTSLKGLYIVADGQRPRNNQCHKTCPVKAPQALFPFCLSKTRVKINVEAG